MVISNMSLDVQIPMAENKWITGVITLLIRVITPFLTGWGPPCRHPNTWWKGIWTPIHISFLARLLGVPNSHRFSPGMTGGFWMSRVFYFYPDPWGKWSKFDLRIFFEWVEMLVQPPTSFELKETTLQCWRLFCYLGVPVYRIPNHRDLKQHLTITLPETNSLPMKIPIFPSKYHQNGELSMAMLVYRSVVENSLLSPKTSFSVVWGSEKDFSTWRIDGSIP